MINAQRYIWRLPRGDDDGPNAEVAPTVRTFGQAKFTPLLVATWLRQTVPFRAFDEQAI